ncbi:MAG: hypothetical protein AAGG46_08070, partial [Planctomycetota bacterium]
MTSSLPFAGAQPVAPGGGDIGRLAEIAAYQLELTHRGNGPEYRHRQATLAAAVRAWNNSGKTAEDRAAFAAWLRAATRASM